MRLRAGRWRIEETRGYADCQLLRLAGIGPASRGRRLAVLYPFDRPQPLDTPVRLRRVGRHRWFRAFRALVCGATPCGRLRTAASARIDLHAYQIEPALAVLGGFATRVLLADEVGLGKTIQAGLLVAELQSRDQAARTLILTPAGLRDQWAFELRERFSVAATIVDAAAVRRGAAQVAAGVNPWSMWPVIIASLDFVKRPEVLCALDALTWDLLVVDEAHGCARAPERSAAVRTVAARARRVALITATPHPGDDEAFAALCAIGELSRRPTTNGSRPTTNNQQPTTDDQIVMFRRSRADVGLACNRRVRLVHVRCTEVEHQMHRLLDRYTRAVWTSPDASPDARLAMVVLRKRAFSSAASLVRSLERRLDALFDVAPAATQIALPFPGAADRDEETPEDEEPVGSLAAPGLDAVRERAWIARTLEAARAVGDRESKMARLARLLRRTPEPAVVFTEYRDTARRFASALAPFGPVVLLHGALSRSERLDAERAFRTGAARILVATDAAGEGLNLQHRCRLVINLELPWNPARLEQRIGRVDRLGQQRRPHAIHLVAAATAEERIVGRLLFRQQRARRAIGCVVDAVGANREEEVAQAVMSGDIEKPADVRAAVDNAAACFSTLDMHDIADDEVRRLQLARAVGLGPSDRLPVAVDVAGGLLSVLPARRARHVGLAAGLLCVFAVRLVQPSEGEVLDECLVALRVETARSEDQRPPTTEDVDRVGRSTALRERALAEASKRLEAAAAAHRRATATARTRERALAAAGRVRSEPVQPGMFDRRAIREAERDEADRSAREREQSDHLARLERQALAAPVAQAELSLALVIDR